MCSAWVGVESCSRRGLAKDLLLPSDLVTGSHHGPPPPSPPSSDHPVPVLAKGRLPNLPGAIMFRVCHLVAHGLCLNWSPAVASSELDGYAAPQGPVHASCLREWQSLQAQHCHHVAIGDPEYCGGLKN